MRGCAECRAVGLSGSLSALLVVCAHELVLHLAVRFLVDTLGMSFDFSSLLGRFVLPLLVNFVVAVFSKQHETGGKRGTCFACKPRSY
jgi:hypothetical protein